VGLNLSVVSVAADLSASICSVNGSLRATCYFIYFSIVRNIGLTVVVVSALIFVATMGSLECELISVRLACGAIEASFITLIVSSISLDTAALELLLFSYTHFFFQISNCYCYLSIIN